MDLVLKMLIIINCNNTKESGLLYFIEKGFQKLINTCTEMILLSEYNITIKQLYDCLYGVLGIN